ncbi:MAG: hypothetical protein WCP97_07415 [bacterium]
MARYRLEMPMPGGAVGAFTRGSIIADLPAPHLQVIGVRTAADTITLATTRLAWMFSTLEENGVNPAKDGGILTIRCIDQRMCGRKHGLTQKLRRLFETGGQYGGNNTGGLDATPLGLGRQVIRKQHDRTCGIDKVVVLPGIPMRTGLRIDAEMLHTGVCGNNKYLGLGDNEHDQLRHAHALRIELHSKQVLRQMVHDAAHQAGLSRVPSVRVCYPIHEVHPST